MSNAKNPNAFDDLDAEATVMSPNAGQNLLNMIPPPPSNYQTQAKHTPPPMAAFPPQSSSMLVAPTQVMSPGLAPGGFSPSVGSPPSGPNASPAPFVSQGPGLRPSVSSEITESSETKLLQNPGDISSEQTVVHGTLNGPLVPLAKLVIQEGLQKNKEYPLLGSEISFGREKDNIITYPDLSVSRHHFKIHCNKEKFSLEDLGSGNGTWVNNKKVKGTIPLNHGDQIRVGKSLIQFLMIGKEAKSNAGPRSSSSTMILVIFLALVLVGGGTFAVVWFNPRGQSNPQATATNVEQAATEMRRGLVLRRQEKWLEAKLAFEQALQLDPTNLQAQQLLEDTKTEINTIHQLQRIQFLMAQDNLTGYKEAKEMLTRLGSNLAPGSSSAPKAWALLTTANRKLRELEPSTPKPSTDPEQTNQSPKVREEVWGFETSYQCRRQCRGRGKQCKRFTRTANGKRQSRWLCVAKGTVKPPAILTQATSPTPVVPKTSPSGDLSRGDRLYRSGDLQGAAIAYEKANETDKQQQVLKFAKVYYESLSAYKNYDPRAAVPALQEALKLDLIIGEGKSVYTQQIRQMLANMYFSKGLLLMGRQSYTTAYEQFVLAIRERPQHRHALQKMQELRVLAQQWLEQAKGLLKSNPEQAKLLLQKIRRVTPSKDVIHKEASKLLSGS